MASHTGPVAHQVAGATPVDRDRFADLLRVASILVVVAGHWLMAVVVWRDGRAQGGNALALVPGLWLATGWSRRAHAAMGVGAGPRGPAGPLVALFARLERPRSTVHRPRPPRPTLWTTAGTRMSGTALGVAGWSCYGLAPMSPGFLGWLGERLGSLPGSLDVVLAAQGIAGDPPLELRPGAGPARRPRAARAQRYRGDLQVWTDPDGAGVLVLGRGLAGRREVLFHRDGADPT
ncbi:MAG TPA: hypothetical protein VLA80_14615 [Actinomycetota bacterium]|nr:hypothetical protein [Actinomycetota bacterium]